MRTKLAFVTLAWTGVCFAQLLFVPFPSDVQGGRESLDDWVSENAEQYPSWVEGLDHPNGEIAVLYHSSGSGRALIDVYVYGCTPTKCSLIALTRGVLINPLEEKPLVAELDSEGSEFVLRNENGNVIFRIALPED